MKKINFFLMLLFLTQNKSMEEEEINTFNKFSKNVADLIREKLLKRGKKTNINLYEIGTKYKDREEVKNNLRKLEDQYSMILNQNKRLINEKDILKQNEKKINIESINNATKLLINGGLIFVLIGLIIKINQILKNELLKKIINFSEIEKYISYPSILLTIFFILLLKKIKYWTNERDNIKVPEFKLLIDLNQLTINIKNEENKLDNLNTYLNQIEDATNKNFAEIIKNTFIYLSKNPNSSFSSAITNSKNQESFSDSKNKNLIGEKSPIYQFYLETRELLDKYKENEKDEVEKIYERMQINIPTQESYKKGDQINSLERFDGQFYIDQGKKFSDEILNKFKNQEKKCVNYLFSGEAGTSKTQTIYKIEQNIIDNLEENQELIIIKIKQTNIVKATDVDIIEELVKYHNSKGKCVIIEIDEADAHMNDRSKLETTDPRYNTVTRMLSFFESLKNQNACILAATNFLDNIDKAIQRPGRMNHVTFYLPNADERNEIIMSHINNNEKCSSLFNALESEFNLELNEVINSKGQMIHRNAEPFTREIFAAFITFLTIKASIAKTIETTKLILDHILDHKNDKYLLNKQSNFWVDNHQKRYSPQLFIVRKTLANLLYTLLPNYHDRGDLDGFLNENFMPVLHHSGFESYQNGTVAKKLLDEASRQDSNHPEIKLSTRKILNPEKICPHTNFELLIKNWNREYAYPTITSRKKLKITRSFDIQIENFIEKIESNQEIKKIEHNQEED